MISNVDARLQILTAARFGKRGVILGGAHTDFRGVNPREFMDYSNQNTTIICQIESREALEDLDAIAATPGVDVLWVGHFDLTQSLGIPGQFDHDLFHDALRQVVGAAQHYGLGVGIQPGSLAQAQEWMEIGFDVISYSGDLSVYLAALAQSVAAVRQIAAGGAG